MSIVRWGLVSTANINRRVIPAIRASKRAELVAVGSRAAESAAAYAAEWGIPQAYGSYEELLAAPDVDAVYISLPNTMHAEWTIKALEAGKHVLCEKPFAINLDEVDAMIAAAGRTGRILAEAFMYRHHPQTKTVLDWVRSGKLGEIKLVRALFSFMISGEANIRLQPHLAGGSLWDVGIYPVSFAQAVMGGAPTHVSAFQTIGKSGVDVFFNGSMKYANGGQAQIVSAFNMPFQTSAEVIGSAGRLYLNRPFVSLDQNRQLIFEDESGRTEPIAVEPEYLYQGEIEDMNAAILDGATPYLTLAETRDHVKTLLALYQAAETGNNISLA
ncbi:MAG: Gfo/Idh/MocA family oxidoreductase [Anaerolineales bacterium]|nr:Gfo/Idh/MocA family oxidoreductase [Anaerolineales bacterium]